MPDLAILILSTILIVSCFYKFAITNLYTLFSFLYVVFYLFPALDRIYKWELIEFRLFNYSYGNVTLMKYLLVFNVIIAIFFGLGYNLIYKKSDIFLIKREEKYERWRIYFILLMLFISVLWLFSFSWQGELYELFLPSRKKGLITSGYVKLYAFLTPTVLAFIAAKSKLKERYFIYLICLFIIFISGQRRFIINFILLITIGENINRTLNFQKYIKYFIAFIALVPGLWYARSIFSQIQRGIDITDVGVTRSIGYLIFGSPSSGFESMLFYEKFRNFLDLNYFMSIEYLLFAAIPRNILKDKPETISSLVKTKFNWEGNPSIFFTNEMYINFGYTAPVFALILGMILAYGANRKSFISIIILAGVLTLFKGGFSYYFTEIIFFIIVYSILTKILKLRIV